MKIALERTDRGRNGGRGVLPWASLIGGGALAGLGAWRGVARRSVTGVALAGLGGYLVYRGATAKRIPETVMLETSVTVNATPEEAYRFWHNFEDLPRFMRHLESVRFTSPRRSQWRAHLPSGRSIAWNAETVEDRDGELISWRTLPGSDIDHYGWVRFRLAPGDKGTEITVRLEYRPPLKGAGHLVAKLLGNMPEFQIREDLRRFKNLIEAGEIPTTEGQPSGRRSGAVSVLHRLQRQYAPEPHWTREARPA